MEISSTRLLSSSSEDVFKTSSSRPIYSPSSYVFRRRLQQVLQRCLQDIFKTSVRRIQHVFETYCEDDYLQKITSTMGSEEEIFSKTKQRIHCKSLLDKKSLSFHHALGHFKTSCPLLN